MTNINDKSKYWKTLLLMSTYYMLPSLQFVMFQAHDNNVECFYNFKCKHDFNSIPAFNNVISNIFYVIFGFTFLLIVKFYRTPYNFDKSLYYSIGITLMLEGLCSSLYHTCPSQLNFQFDTSFMFIGTSLTFLTLYSKRHKNRIPSVFRFFAFLSCIILINILPLSGASNGNEIWFWLVIDLFLAYTMLFGSIYVYYGKEYDLDIDSICELYNKIRNIKYRELPRFLLLLIINTFTLSMIIYGSFENPEFTTWLLGLFIINMVIYFNYYIVQKLIHKEYINRNIWFCLAIDIVILITALIYFEIPISDKYLTPEKSRELNHDCVLFNYWDYHDIWHIFSAMGLFLFMNIVFFIDSDIDFDDDYPVF